MRHDIEPIVIIDTEFLQTATRQACLLLRASGSTFHVCAHRNALATASQIEIADAAHGNASSCADAFSCAASYGTTQETWAGQLPMRMGPLAELLGLVCERRQAITYTSAKSAAMLAVPAIWRDRVHGVLVVTDDLPSRRFDEQDATLLESLAEMTAAALHQAERLTRMTAQFRALHTIDVALTSSLQLDRVLNLILEKAIGLVGAEHGSLRLLNPDTGELVLKAHLGDGWTPEIRAYTFQSGHGIVGWVAENLQPYLCPDAHSDPQNVLLFDEMHSGVAVPLLRRPGEAAHGNAFEHDELLGGPILMGVLLLESTRLAAFDQRDVELLEALAQKRSLPSRMRPSTTSFN
jgi:GAF domain-containing protein